MFMCTALKCSCRRPASSGDKMSLFVPPGKVLPREDGVQEPIAFNLLHGQASSPFM